MQVSVIIRTCNEERYIGQLIEVLQGQAYNQQEIEIVVVDSGSSDRTVEIACSYDTKFVDISHERFNYSKALNDGIAASCGEKIVMLSAHAIPTSDQWLSAMLKPFEDERVAGVYCRQLPWPDAIWQERIRLERVFPSQGNVFVGPNMNGMYFSNAASCIRRDLWLEHPFKIMPAAEDREWANWALEKGYYICYEAGAQAYHSHNESCRDIAKRHIQICNSIDMKKGIKRTRLLTLKSAMRWFWADGRKAFFSAHCRRARIKALMDCVRQSYWFYVDFNRSG